MNTPRPRCPVCTKAMVSAYIFSRGKWTKVGHYCKVCDTTTTISKVLVRA